MRVMISAASSPVAPGIIRHLQKLGHHVIGHDCKTLGAGARMCDEFHQSPETQYRERYRHFVESIKYDAYLPFLDEELWLFARGTENVDTISIFTDKIAQQSAMERANLPVAPRAMWGDVAIMKPKHGRGSRVSEVQPFIRPPGEHLFQKKLHGPEFTVDILTDLDGKFLYACPRERVSANGVSIIGRIVADFELIDMAKALTKAFRFSGPLNMQVIRDGLTGEAMIIEVNARLSGSCMFTVMSGWDILRDSIRVFMGLQFVPPEIVSKIMVRRYYVEERV